MDANIYRSPAEMGLIVLLASFGVAMALLALKIVFRHRLGKMHTELKARKLVRRPKNEVV